MKKLNLSIIAVLLFGTVAVAQDRSTYFSYLLNPYNINPAYTGNKDNINVMLNTKTWMNTSLGTPRNFMFGIHGKAGRTNGIGGKVIADYRGAFQYFNAELCYSKKIILADGHFLTFGASGGFGQITLNTSSFTQYVDKSDPAISSFTDNNILFTSGAGILYKWGNRLDFGFSTPTLITSGAQLNQHFFVQTGYNFFPGISKEWKVRPNLTYQHLPASNEQLDMNLMGSWKEMIWAQFTYRTNASFVYMAGINFREFSLGYAYNMNTSTLKEISSGSNEIFISIGFNKPQRRIMIINDSNSQIVENELNKIKMRLDELIEIDKKNPGTVNVKKELSNINKDLQHILKTYKIDNVEKLKTDVREIQEQIDTLLKQYQNK